VRRPAAEPGGHSLNQYQFAALIIAAVGLLLAGSRHFNIPALLVLFGAGIISAFIPGLRPAAVDPDLALTLFLPPLIYASTVRISWRLLRFTMVPGVIIGIALILVTVICVAVAVRLILLPGLSWTAAIFIGAVASIFDTQLFHEAKGRPHVPRAISDALKARELVSRLFILATLTLGEEALESGRVAAQSIALNYLFDIPAGVVLGFLVGTAIVWIRRRIDPAPVEIAVSISTPYVAALSAEALGISAVAAITTTALVVSAVRIDRHTGETISSAEARVSSTAFWEEASLMISSALFFLAGRAMVEALGTLEAWPVWRLVAVSGAVLLIVLLVQFTLSLPATMLHPIAGALRSQGGGRAGMRAAAAAIMAWSSTRSVIGLVIALSIPVALPNGQPYAERDLILIVGAFLIVGSVLLQGLTLRTAVTRANLSDEGEEEREEEKARAAISEAAANPQQDGVHDSVRQVLTELRERDEIGDEVLLRMLRETDLHARASEKDVLPGAGPPNP
jgi:CPA1 family monovalent cation:H+ antiporter